MSVDQSVDLVLYALQNAKNGDICAKIPSILNNKSCTRLKIF